MPCRRGTAWSGKRVVLSCAGGVSHVVGRLARSAARRKRPSRDGANKVAGKATGRLLGEITGRISLPPSRCKTAAIRVKPSRSSPSGGSRRAIRGGLRRQRVFKKLWQMACILHPDE